MTDKKLLVLDVNGLLIDTYFHKEPLPEESPDARVGNFYVYKRPFCEEFLQFCLENFIVGIWSSAREYNVNNLVDYVFGNAKERLAFSWHQSDCTDVGLKAPDNQWKPLFMKELSKLWRKVKVDLPWSEGDYGPTNTLLVDDTPYKAVLNPPNTAIFPRSYTARDHGDTFLGGALRSYLEGIRDAPSVQTYVENNPFGEPSITPESPLWSHISKVLLRVQNVLDKVTDEIAQVLPVEATSDDNNGGGRRRRPRFRKWKRYSDFLPPTDDTRQLVDFPSEAIELQSSGNTVQSEEFHDSAVGEQAHEVGVGRNEMVVLSGPLRADVQSKDEQPLLEISHMDSGRNEGDDRMIREVSLSCQQELQGTVFGADRTTMEEHASVAEQTFYDRKQAYSNTINVQLDNIQEQGGDEVDDQWKEENGQMVCDKSSFNALESNLMQVEGNAEQSRENKGSITPSGDHFRTSYSCEAPNNFCSDRSWVKHGRFHGQSFKSHGKRNYSHRDRSDFNHSWKRQKGFYRDNIGSDYNQIWKGQEEVCRDSNRHSCSFVHSWGGRKVWDGAHNRDRIGYDANWRRQRHRGATNMPPISGREQRRRRQNDNLRYGADKGYGNRDSSFSSYARPSEEMRNDRPVDVPADYSFGQSRVSSSRNAVIDKDFSGEFYQSSGGVHVTTTNSHVCAQDRAPSSDQWYHGFEPKVAYEGSTVWPETAVDRSMKSWHSDWANREAGASSEPYRSGRASSWSYRSSGASRLPYQSVGASMQQHHSYSYRRNRW